MTFHRPVRLGESAMAWSLRQVIEARQADQYRLHGRYINPSMARVQGIIGSDKIYIRGEGAYLWDAGGARYVDLLTGFSVFNLGRAYPTIEQAIQEAISLDRPGLVRMRRWLRSFPPSNRSWPTPWPSAAGCGRKVWSWSSTV
jgi:hypothetical protein